MKQGGQWGNKNRPTAKRIAWAYLLPLGLNGELNIGFSDEWKTSSSSRMTTPVKRSPQKTNGLDDSNHEKTTNEDENSSQNSENLELPIEKEERIKALLYHTKKKNVDIALRLQLFQYHRYDGPIGFLQRKVKGWPAYTNYVNMFDSIYYILISFIIHQK